MSFNSVSSDVSAFLTALSARATLLRQLREFFHARGFIDVETPLVAPEVIPEQHIEPLRTADGQFLQASPELHMKRLMAAGTNAIFQVTRSFRADERGRLHNPEFTIVEWYRAGDDFAAGIDLLDELASSLLGTPPAVRTTYAEAFERLELCPHSATANEMAAAAERAGAAIPVGLKDSANRDEWLNFLLGALIEPELGRDRPEILYHYPATQAALAKVVESSAGYPVAERFELYSRGIELANGFHELTNADELRRRFETVNAARLADGRCALPMPQSLLSAMEQGLPACAGCALGFDRLAMLVAGATSIDAVIAFPCSRGFNSRLA